MLNILEVVHGLPPDSSFGTELYAYHLSVELRQLGHRVTLLYPKLDPLRPVGEFSESSQDGVDVVKCNLRLDGATAITCSDFDGLFEAFLREKQIDVVHVQHIAGLPGSWLTAAMEMGIPVVVKLDDMYYYCLQIHQVNREGSYCVKGPESVDKCVKCLWGPEDGSTPREISDRYSLVAYHRSYWKRLLSEVDCLHTPSRFLLESYPSHGISNSNLRLIRTGIKPFPSLPRSDPVPGRTRIGFLGAIQARKGIYDLLEAIRLVSDPVSATAVSDSLEFILYGREVDSGLVESVRSAEATWENLSYRGEYQPHERPRIFSEIDLLIVPSIGENYPFIIREALYAGIPVVATRVAGIPEIVLDGVNGLLYAPGDTAGLGEILVRIAHEPDLARCFRVDSETVRFIREDAEEIAKLLHQIVCDRLERASDTEELIRRGTAFIHREEFELARTAFERARRFGGDRPEVLQGLGVVAYHAGAWARAAELFEAAHQLDPGDASTIVNWALAATKLGRIREMDQIIRAAHLAHPEDGDLRQLAEAI